MRAMEGRLPTGIQKHRNRYRVRRRAGGKWVVRSFQSLEEAEDYLARLVGDKLEKQAVELARISGALTVMDVVRLWWLGPVMDGEHRGGHRRRLTGQTERNYQYYIDAYICRIGGESAQSYARNPGLLKLFYDSLPNRCAWHVHGVLRLVFAEALTRGLVDRNPCMDVKPAPRKRSKRLVPSRREVAKLLIAAQEHDPVWGLFVYLTSVLGTRCGESVALQTEDFDEAERVVHIERAVSKTAGGPTLKLPKKGEPRELPIDDAAFWAHVRPFLQQPGFLFRGFRRDELRGQTGATGKPWHPDHAQARFRKMVRALGLPGYTLHSLRHFVATQLLIEGQPINQVAEFLGHAPQMTLMLYGRHLDLEAMKRVGRAATTLVTRPTPAPAARGEDSAAKRDPTRVRATVVQSDVADDIVFRLAQDGPITNATVRSQTSLTRRQVSKALDRLVRDGRIVRKGLQRGIFYERLDFVGDGVQEEAVGYGAA